MCVLDFQERWSKPTFPPSSADCSEGDPFPKVELGAEQRAREGWGDIQRRVFSPLIKRSAGRWVQMVRVEGCIWDHHLLHIVGIIHYAKGIEAELPLRCNLAVVGCSAIPL